MEPQMRTVIGLQLIALGIGLWTGYTQIAGAFCAGAALAACIVESECNTRNLS